MGKTVAAVPTRSAKEIAARARAISVPTTIDKADRTTAKVV